MEPIKSLQDFLSAINKMKKICQKWEENISLTIGDKVMLLGI